MLNPNQFMPLTEEMGLIVPLGEWVLREACREAAAWPDDVKVAVNLSPVQFSSRDLVQTVAAALAESGLAARRLELEITETVLLQDSEEVLGILHGLRALGVRISMDDFGTGYSSLSYLRSFPFDKIKIDQSFVRDLSHNAEDAAAIVRAVARLGSSLGMATTAEGVETQRATRAVARGRLHGGAGLPVQPAPAGKRSGGIVAPARSSAGHRRGMRADHAGWRSCFSARLSAIWQGSGTRQGCQVIAVARAARQSA